MSVTWLHPQPPWEWSWAALAGGQGGGWRQWLALGTSARTVNHSCNITGQLGLAERGYSRKSVASRCRALTVLLYLAHWCSCTLNPIQFGVFIARKTLRWLWSWSTSRHRSEVQVLCFKWAAEGAGRVSLEKKRLRKDLIALYNHLKARGGLFSSHK